MGIKGLFPSSFILCAKVVDYFFLHPVPKFEALLPQEDTADRALSFPPVILQCI
ncbi:MAG: hypothetical protein ACRCT1_02260 [Microcoleaceae cyanobacterium]